MENWGCLFLLLVPLLTVCCIDLILCLYDSFTTASYSLTMHRLNQSTGTIQKKDHLYKHRIGTTETPNCTLFSRVNRLSLANERSSRQNGNKVCDNGEKKRNKETEISDRI